MTQPQFHYTHLTLNELRTLAASPQVGTLDAMPHAFRTLAAHVGDVAEILHRAQTDLPNWWKGQAADQASAALGRAAKEAREFHESALGAATVVARCANIVAEQQHQMMTVPEVAEPGVTAVVARPENPMEALEAARQDTAYHAAHEQAVQIVNGIAAQYVETRAHLAAIGVQSGSSLDEASDSQTPSRQKGGRKDPLSTSRDPLYSGNPVLPNRSTGGQPLSTGKNPSRSSTNSHVEPIRKRTLLRPPTSVRETHQDPNRDVPIRSLKTAPPLNTSTNYRTGEPKPAPSGCDVHAVAAGNMKVADKLTHPLPSANPRAPSPGYELDEFDDSTYRATQGYRDSALRRAVMALSSPKTQSEIESRDTSANLSSDIADRAPMSTTLNKQDGSSSPPPTRYQARDEGAKEGLAEPIASAIGNPQLADLSHTTDTSLPFIPPFSTVAPVGHNRDGRGPRPSYLKERKSTWFTQSPAAPPDGIITPEWLRQSHSEQY